MKFIRTIHVEPPATVGTLPQVEMAKQKHMILDLIVSFAPCGLDANQNNTKRSLRDRPPVLNTKQVRVQVSDLTIPDARDRNVFPHLKKQFM